MAMKRDPKRSSKAIAYRAMYRTPEWRRISAAQLAAEPNCRMCEQEGRTTRATVCDHVTPHRGDSTLFFNGPFQSLCDGHHCSAKQRIEARGFDSIVDASGWPIDPRHPANRE
jgi:5-methylcytosine-specific restriction enzyme A